jgi:hypothetical protein
MSRFSHVVKVSACFIALRGDPAQGADIVQDFRKDLLPGVLELNPVDGIPWVRTDRGLLITIPGGRKDDVKPNGVLMRKPITGDFEATLEYELIKAEQPDQGYGSGVILWVRPEGQTGKLTVGRSELRREGRSFFTTYCAPMGKDTAKGRKEYEPTQSRIGGVRLVRTGADVSFQVSEDGGAFREIRQETFGPVPLREINLYADTGRAMTALEVLLKTFHLRADAIADMPVATAQVAVSERPMGATLIVVAAVAVAGLLAWVWRLCYSRPKSQGA